MGMYDNITFYCDGIEYKNRSYRINFKGYDFQTKDLENSLLSYEVDKNGVLCFNKNILCDRPKSEIEFFKKWYKKEFGFKDEGISKFIDAWSHSKICKIEKKLIDYTGTIDVVTSDDNLIVYPYPFYIEFKVSFNNGLFKSARMCNFTKYYSEKSVAEMKQSIFLKSISDYKKMSKNQVIEDIRKMTYLSYSECQHIYIQFLRALDDQDALRIFGYHLL